ncbi:MAG: hypothetical protein PHV37_03910 [Candidatus Gastranaerophilales bacterium]|nr:hypothetical protein [Candidatus Gastranaerophilales bacterium]
MKKFFATLIGLCIISMNLFCLSAHAETTQGTVFEGHAEITDKADQKPDTIFSGETEKIETKDTIDMTVSQVLSAGISQEGDEFFAEVTNEVIGDKGVLLPLGTIAHGTIRGVQPSKRLGRDGWIELSFDYLVTPDGREIPIDGKMTTRLHPVAGVAKAVATDAAYTVAGGVVGGVLAANMFGLEGAIASQGYTLMGGAGVGAGVGLGISLFRKGKDALISPGDLIKVKMKSDIKLPVISFNAMKQDEQKYDGLTVKINNINLEKDPFGEENTIALNLLIQNNSKKNFSSFDVSLVNDLGACFFPSVFAEENSLAFTQIKIGDRVAGRLAFGVDNPKRKFWLVFYDRQTRKPVAKISIDNAKRQLEAEKKQKKRRK